jgi:UDP-glucose 4-epimerase
LVVTDLLDGDSIGGLFGGAFEGVEIVYHLAADPDVRYAPGDPTDAAHNRNVRTTYNALTAMRLHGVRKIVFTSSSAVYGIAPKLPIRENDFFPRPISLYGASKLACEGMCSSYSRLFDIDCWVLRLANIVGPKIRTRGRTVIGDFIAKLRQDPTRLEILGDGRQRKSYLTTRECVEGMLFAVEHADEPYNALNLGGDDSVTVTRIAEVVIEAMGLHGVELLYTGGEGGWPGDVPHFVLDASALGRLGWKPRLSSEESVAEAIRETLEGER